MSKCHLSLCGIIKNISELETRVRANTLDKHEYVEKFMANRTSDYASFNDMIITRACERRRENIIMKLKKTNKYEQIEIIRNELYPN